MNEGRGDDAHKDFIIFFPLYISAATLHNNAVAVAAAKLAAQNRLALCPQQARLLCPGIDYSKTQRRAMKQKCIITRFNLGHTLKTLKT